MPEQNNKSICHTNQADPTLNVREIINEAVERLDDLRTSEVNRIKENMSALNDKLDERDIKYQIQFTAAEKAVGIASTAQKELVAQALAGTKEAITKADTTNDKRLELISDQIRVLSETLNTNKGAQGIYVTHTDLSIFGEKLQSGFEDVIKPLVTQVNILTAAQNSQQGKSSGLNAGWGYLVGGIGLISTITLLALRF